MKNKDHLVGQLTSNYVDAHSDDYSNVSVDVDTNVGGVAAADGDDGDGEVGDDADDDYSG